MFNSMNPVICDGCKVPSGLEHRCHGDENIVVSDVAVEGPCECPSCLEERVWIKGEIVRRLTSSANRDFSVAVAYLIKSEPHRHPEGVETYVLLSGRLEVFVGEADDEYHLLTKLGATAHIPQGKRHWAKSSDGKVARISVVSIPAWNPGGHVYA